VFAAAVAVVAFAGVVPSSASAAVAPIPANADWLTTVNYYRSLAGLSGVVENPEWSAGAVAHSQYMVRNQVLSHDEDAGNPWTSPAGKAAANNGNVALNSSASATPRQVIEQWMTAPFHSIGLLRPNLRQTGFGMFNDSSSPLWDTGATIDVLRGQDPAAGRPSAPVVFPGDGTVTSLDRMSAESPDPRSFCGWSGTVGLPLIAMFSSPTGAASTTISGPSGPVDACSLTTANTSSTAQMILAGDNAVAVLPRSVLSPGSYTVTVTTSAAGSVTWSFTVDPSVADAPIVPVTLPSTGPTGPASAFSPMAPTRVVDTRRGLAATRLAAGVPTRLDIAGRLGVPADASAVSANLTVVNPAASGYLTTYPCGGAVPVVSSVNFSGGQVVANAALLPLDAGGDLCVASSADTELLIDVNGSFRAAGSDLYTPLAPARLLDTRTGLGGSGRLAPGVPATLTVRGKGGVPVGATAVVLNVTAVDPAAGPSSYVTVYPCGAVPDASNLNLRAGETRPNLVVVPVSASGTVCLVSTVATNLLADVTGSFSPTGSRRFTPLAPIRVVDTRQADARLNAGTSGVRLSAGREMRVVFAGQRGIPAGATAVSVNLTVTQVLGGGYLTAYPCGSRPDSSNLNYEAGTEAANAAQLTLDSQGAACFFATGSTAFIVDVNGAWT